MTKTEKKQNRIVAFFCEKPLHWYDYLILAALMLFCFLSFEMGDLLHTAGCSYAYLNGHIFDFYDALATESHLHASYLPSVYLVFAIWNLPMYLCGQVTQPTEALTIIPIMWAKILPCLVFLASGLVVFSICRQLSMGNHKSKICLYAYLSAPVALFGQFLLGQYESFLVLFVLLGIDAWLRKKNFRFVLYFAIAMTFKYTALLIFLPLLLLREKNIGKILLCTAGSFVLMAVEILLYHSSEAFMSYAFGIGGSGDQPTGYIANSLLYTGFNLGENVKFSVYLTILAFAFVVAYAYFRKPKSDKEEQQYGFYLMGLGIASFFCLSKFHPQWLLLAVPVWTISAFLHKNTKIFMALDLLFMAFFTMFTVCQFATICDEQLLNTGIWKYWMPGGVVSSAFQMKEWLGGLDPSVTLSFLVAMMAVFAFFKHPKYMAIDHSETVDSSMGWIRARYIGGLLIFIIPAMMSLFTTIKAEKPYYKEENREIFLSAEITGSFVSQGFTVDGDYLSKIKFPVSVGTDPGNGTVEVSVIENEGTDTHILASKTYTLSSFSEGELVTLPVSAKVSPENSYTVTFQYAGEEGSTFSLLASDDENQSAIVDAPSLRDDFVFTPVLFNPPSLDYPFEKSIHLCLEIYR